MSTSTPVVVDGELIGWEVDQEAEYRTLTGVDGMEVIVQTRKASRLFIPAGGTKPNHVRDAVRANQ